MSHTEDQDRNSTRPSEEESKSFWKGLVIGAVIVLIPAIFANQKQREFIALQKKVLDLYKEQSSMVGIAPEPETGAVRGNPPAIPIYDAGLDLDPSHPLRNVSEDGYSTEIYLGAGAILQVAENRTARVFGNDKCSNEKTRFFHSAGGEGGDGCARLTGNRSIKVRLIFEDGSALMESWQVNTESGDDGERYQLTRPNGWILREANL